MAETEPCVFCDLFSRPEAQPFYNVPLHETKHFAVIPALGPLHAGHILVVPKEHVPSLAASGTVAIAEYETLIRFVRRVYGELARNMLEAEHGGTEDETGGACIRHGHINAIPTFGKHAGAFDRVLIPTGTPAELSEVNPARPYVLLRAHGLIRTYDAHNIGPQFIRRVLCECVGRDDWDWALSPNHELLRRTIEIWAIT